MRHPTTWLILTTTQRNLFCNSTTTTAEHGMTLTLINFVCMLIFIAFFLFCVYFVYNTMHVTSIEKNLSWIFLFIVFPGLLGKKQI